jgi:hypothetical protein
MVIEGLALWRHFSHLVGGFVFSLLDRSVLVVFCAGGVLYVIWVWSMYFKLSSILIQYV